MAHQTSTDDDSDSDLYRLVDHPRSEAVLDELQGGTGKPFETPTEANRVVLELSDIHKSTTTATERAFDGWVVLFHVVPPIVPGGLAIQQFHERLFVGVLHPADGFPGKAEVVGSSGVRSPVYLVADLDAGEV